MTLGMVEDTELTGSSDTKSSFVFQLHRLSFLLLIIIYLLLQSFLLSNLYDSWNTWCDRRQLNLQVAQTRSLALHFSLRHPSLFTFYLIFLYFLLLFHCLLYQSLYQHLLFINNHQSLFAHTFILFFLILHFLLLSYISFYHIVTTSFS